MSAQDLLGVFASAYPAQPATAFWRAIEIAALASREIPSGLGLDLGCGDGILTDILLGQIGPRRFVGLDLDPLETEAARRFPFYERIHTCSADRIPERDGSIDFVLSNSVLEHLPPIEGAISEVGRLLRKGGRFFFTVPGPGFHMNLFGSVLPWVPRDKYLAALDERLAHVRYLSKGEWAALLSRHGLVLDQCLGYMDRRQTRRWESLSRMTGGLLYTLSGGRSRPIEIQRKIGARGFQNRRRLPRIVAQAVAGLATAGVHLDRASPCWIEPAKASCLLLEGHRG